jgi:glycogen(starch) synthase
MRILHVLDHSPPGASPYTWRVMAILRQQRALGWQTCHLTGPHHAAFTRGSTGAVAGDWHFYRTAAHDQAGRLPLLGAVSHLARRLQQVVQLTRPDLLHAHSPLENTLAALRVGRRHGVPVVVEIHAPAPASIAGSVWTRAPCAQAEGTRTALACFAMRAFEAWAAARAGAVVTNSEGMRRRLQDGGVSARRITVVPDALDLARYTAAESIARPAQLIIGCVASAGNLDLPLAALAILASRSIRARLLVACGAADEAAWRRAAIRRGMGERLTILPYKATDSAAEMHRLADLVLFCDAARHAVSAPPRRLLEAMARGCVVVVADTPAHRSLVQHGRNGMLFTTGDAAALADVLNVTAAARARWPALRANARWFIEYHRSWEVCVARYGPVYQRLLETRRRG